MSRRNGEMDPMSIIRAREACWWAQDGQCCWCLQDVPENEATLEHVIPLSDGGTNEPHNLRMACKNCNEARSTGLQDELRAKRRRQRAKRHARAAKRSKRHHKHRGEGRRPDVSH